MTTEELRGVRRYISRKQIEIDGKAFIEEIYEVDHGPKLGVTKVRVLDPCVTEEAQQRRREAIAALAGRLVECHSEFWSRASYGDEEVDEGRVSGRREDVEA